MKKLVLLSLPLLLIASLFQSCKTETLGVTRVTTYPTLEIIGDDLIFIEVGEAYTEEGAEAFIGETPVEFQTVGVVNTNQPGFYNVRYVAVNDEGFSLTVVRTVIVYESGLVSGLYDGIRVNSNAGGPVLIYDNGDGNFFITDLLGGFYEYVFGYGPDYAFPAVIDVDTDAKTFSIVSGGVGGFGQADVAGITISDDFTVWEYTQILVDQGGFSFDVRLTKVF
jgi:hypothetical protein